MLLMEAIGLTRKVAITPVSLGSEGFLWCRRDVPIRSLEGRSYYVLNILKLATKVLEAAQPLHHALDAGLRC